MKKIITLLCLLGTHAVEAQMQRKTYYDPAQSVVKAIFEVKDTLHHQFHGTYTAFYLSGKKKVEGRYQNHKPSGHWTYYFENGEVRKKGQYLHGHTVGRWSNYFENGNIRSEGNLESDLKSGLWSYYFENGGLKSQGQYKDNHRTGIWHYYYEEGARKAHATFKEDQGLYKEYYPSGKLKIEGFMQQGKSQGQWLYFHDSGEKMAEGYYKEGLKTGTWKYFYTHGQISTEGGYRNGEALGNWIYYYPSGAKRAEGFQKKSQKDGYWKMFYETGETKGTGEFDQGSGQYTEYYISGKLKAKGPLKEGYKYGTWHYYDPEGHEEGKATFQTPGQGYYEGYYTNGNLKMKGSLSKGKRVGDWTLYKKNGNIAGKYRPIYEDTSSVYLQKIHQDLSQEPRKMTYAKPPYKFKKSRLRYFTKVRNEYRGVILATNPMFMLIDRIPLSLEYYLQERQGFEFTYTFHRQPFFKNHDDLSTPQLYSLGSSVSFSQKFYSPAQQLGMFYFGHLLGASFLDHFVNADTPLAGQHQIRTAENRYYYGLFIGNRWAKSPQDAGVTIDFYIGVGLGFRTYSKKYTHPMYDRFFTALPTSTLHIPFLLGIHIGYLGFKRVRNSVSIRPR